MFHETFSLNRPAIAEVLQVLHSHKGEVNLKQLHQRTKLGTNYAKAMPRYARGCGLLEPTGSRLTRFGALALAHDPALQHPATQWLMHYHLSAPHGPGPRFWHYLVTRELRPGNIVHSEPLAEAIAQGLADEAALQARSLRATATVFLGSYAKAEGLQTLGVLKAYDRQRYLVEPPAAPPLAALAVSLACYWRDVLGNPLTVSLDTLTQPGGLADVLLISAAALERLLEQLQRHRVIELYRQAPPYQVARLWDDPDELLHHLYDHDWS
ncbi:DUF4007 family protein [Kallotenue papyrolyticum]|uniref:DUF4007 family protein n=1 Tax=Kallotenue papyrolyticum TaxID=1325125 RepID=UPI0023EB0CD7|nr:DUF4007 family protein [Kallotenue papyrolyticum]